MVTKVKKSKSVSKSTQRNWSFAGLFMILLLLTMPVYSANVLAVGVQVSRNSGTANVDTFIDGNGDTWNVEATITNSLYSEVSPEDVKMQVGSTQIPFQSCSSSTTGINCVYTDDVSGGIPEGEYPFSVVYSYLDAQNQQTSQSSSTHSVKSDASAPQVIGFTVRHDASTGQIVTSFSVTDNVNSGKPFSGLKSIIVEDLDSNTVLLTVDPNAAGFTTGMESYSFNGPVPISLNGAGRSRIRVTAEDLLGHQGTSSIRNLDYDFNAPQIVASSIELQQNGEEIRFLGTQQLTASLSVQIREANFLQSVTANSNSLSFNNIEAVCTPAESQAELWDCVWDQVVVSPSGAGSSINVEVTAIDQYANTVSQSVPISFTSDNNPPTIEYFATERIYDDVSYVSAGEKTRVILRVRDQGAGIDQEDIELNFGFSNPGIKVCEEITGGNGLDCHWDIATPNSQQASIAINRFEDRVNNQGPKPTLVTQVDAVAPIVEELKIEGVSALGTNDFFQSRDQVKITLVIQEDTGLTVLVNEQDIVNDAINTYPESSLSRDLGDGWKIFTEEDPGCRREDGKWLCELLTDSIKSGPDSQAEMQIIVKDTAGNTARQWPNFNEVGNVETFTSAGSNGAQRITFDLLGISEEQNPDFWEVAPGFPRNLIDYIDLDTVELVPTRMAFDVRLRSSEATAQVIDVSLPQNSCRPADVDENELPAPELSRSLLFGGVSANSGPAVAKIMLEVAPFDGREYFDIGSKQEFDTVTVKYVCNLQVITQRVNNVVPFPEIQEVTLEVPFAFSELGALDENLDEKIQDIENEIFFTIADKLTILNDVLTYARYFTGIVTSLYSVDRLLNLVESSSDSYRNVPIFGTAAAVGICTGAGSTGGAIQEAVETFQVPITLLSCNPNPNELGWYGSYQSGVLETYNLISGRTLIGLPAQSVYENLWTASAGLCLPGITNKLEQYRQVRCREMLCYLQDVPQGLATVGSCKELGSFLTCKYVTGNLLLIPGAGAISAAVEFVKGLVTSPLGYVRLGLQIPCLVACQGSGTAASICRWTGGVVIVLDIVNNAYTAFQSWPGKVNNAYCGQVETIRNTRNEQAQPEDEEDVSRTSGDSGTRLVI